jgi:hypothetical protein
VALVLPCFKCYKHASPPPAIQVSVFGLYASELGLPLSLLHSSCLFRGLLPGTRLRFGL